MNLSLNSVSFTNYQAYFGNLGGLSVGQAQSAKSLLSMLDGFGFDGPAQQRFSPMEMMLAPPGGYLRGNMNQALAYAAGFLRGLQQSSMMDISMGARMLLGLSMFQSGALTKGGFSITNMTANFSVGGSRDLSSEKDKFATHESCRTGADNPSNLNNSPHVKLALYNILKDHHDDMPPEQLKKELEEKYGIKSEIATVKGNDGRDLKALKFENGDQLVDGSGNGSFGMADYNLKGAVDDIKEKYGITPEDFDKMAKENPGIVNQIGGFGGDDQGFDGLQGNFTMQMTQVMPFASFQSMFPMRDIANLFAQAYAFAE